MVVFASKCKNSVGTILPFELYPPMFIYNVGSSDNVNIVEWLVSISIEHDPVSGSRSNRVLQFRTGSGSGRILKKINRIRYGYPNCIGHCRKMLNQRVLSDINRIGSNIWKCLLD